MFDVNVFPAELGIEREGGRQRQGKQRGKEAEAEGVGRERG